MANKMDVTNGAEVLLAQPPSLVIEGRTYTMRRLGVTDIIKWISMIRSSGVRGVRGVLDMIGDMKLTQQQVGIAAVIFGLVDLAEDVTGWLASLLGVTREEYEDPDLFPLASHVDVLEALVDHPDIEAFVGKIQAAMRNEDRMRRISLLFGSVPSTQSKPDTDGATSTSSEAN